MYLSGMLSLIMLVTFITPYSKLNKCVVGWGSATCALIKDIEN